MTDFFRLSWCRDFARECFTSPAELLTRAAKSRRVCSVPLKKRPKFTLNFQSGDSTENLKMGCCPVRNFAPKAASNRKRYTALCGVLHGSFISLFVARSVTSVNVRCLNQFSLHFTGMLRRVDEHRSERSHG